MNITIQKATLYDILTTADKVEAYVSSKKAITGLTEPYLSYFYSSEKKNSLKERFVNLKEVIDLEDEFFYIAISDGQIVGFACGGPTIDNYDFDSEIYLLFTFIEDLNFQVRDLLFDKLVESFKILNSKNMHVEIAKDDLNKSFYIRKGGQFITEITNMTRPPYTTIDFGWTDIKAS